MEMLSLFTCRSVGFWIYSLAIEIEIEIDVKVQCKKSTTLNIMKNSALIRRGWPWKDVGGCLSVGMFVFVGGGQHYHHHHHHQRQYLQIHD